MPGTNVKETVGVVAGVNAANMLLQLDIHNVALIDGISIELGAGFNVLTGETGAGKSIIIDSINAVLGDRVSREVIRTGAQTALIEAVFRVDADRIRDIMSEMGMEPEEDGTLILSREISQSGRNTCRINGKMVSAAFMKAIGERLIDMHGQHDNQSLLKTEHHIELLDSFAGESLHSARDEYSALLEQYREVRAKLRALSGDPGERERKMDLLRFQADEIRKARLKPSEDEELGRQKILLINAEKISNTLASVYDLLSAGSGGSSALDAMNDSLARLGSVAGLDESYNEMYRRLQDLVYQLEDLAGDVRQSLEKAEYDPAMLEEIEERLDLIYRLKRKYGSAIPEILGFCQEAEEQLEELEKSEETAKALSEELKGLENRLYDAARRLSAERVKAASLLENEITRQLDDLEMKKAKFSVDIRFDTAPPGQSDRKFSSNGLDKVEFLISPNVGEPLKPLARIASGGEMSRVMLAVKTILAEVDRIPVLIFDEIDTGISGKAAQKVGEKLSYISRNHQVLCVTHQAQIACIADHNYLIEKIVEEGKTRTKVTKLDEDDKTKEIARLIGGETTEASLKYAEEMIRTAKKAQTT
jgi:DNA repair protein RecN (Recombination protein N)